MAESRPQPPRQPLLCSLGWHAAEKGALWNEGYYFSRCQRCGSDLIRTTYSGWEVPRGFRVVWKPRPAEPDAESGPVEPSRATDPQSPPVETDPLPAVPEPEPEPAATSNGAPPAQSTTMAPPPDREPDRELPPALRSPFLDEPSLDSMIERASAALKRGSVRTSLLREESDAPAQKSDETHDQAGSASETGTDAASGDTSPPSSTADPALPESAGPGGADPLLEEPEATSEPRLQPDALADPVIGQQAVPQLAGHSHTAAASARNRSAIPDFMDEPEPPLRATARNVFDPSLNASRAQAPILPANSSNTGN